MNFRIPGLVLGLLLLASGCTARGQAQDRSAQTESGGFSSAEGTLRVSFLDVGQGDAALVQAPGGANVLIDGGPQGAGPAVLKDLSAAGISKLDWIVASHPHEDHIGGLVDVLRELPAEQTLDSGYNHGTSLQKTYLGLLKSKKVKAQRARAGQTVDLGSGARLEVLAPEEPLLKGTKSDPNNNSVVARLVFGKTRFLFTGDMEVEERRRLLQNASAGALSADVLKVAHHGSHNGTDPDFLKAVSPKYAVISLAKGNDYGHPHREAMQALHASGATILRTDERGDIHFSTDGQTLKLEGAPASAPQAARDPAPRPSEGTSSSRETAQAGRVIGNTGSKVYHAPDCSSLPKEDKRSEFKSAQAAEEAGYRPHAACNRGSGM